MQSFQKADLSLLGNKSTLRERPDLLSSYSLDRPMPSLPFQGTSTKLQLSKRLAGLSQTKRPRTGPEDRLCSMFVHYTISEDRTGTDSSIRSGLLAGLGTKSEAEFVFSRKDDGIDTGLESHQLGHRDTIRDGDVQGGADGNSQAETEIQYPEKKPEIGAVTSGAELFVAGIHHSLSEQDLARVFEKYGVVERCSIMVDPQTKESRGFGFVKMMTSAQADAATDRLQGTQMKGRSLSIEKARQTRPRTPPPGLYYDNTSPYPDFQDDAFEDLFFDYDSSGSTNGDVSDVYDLGRLFDPRKGYGAHKGAAQRAFRRQKERHLRDLETKVKEPERTSDSASPENGLLRAQIERLQAELKEYRKRMDWVSNDGSTRPPNSLSRPKTAGNGHSNFQIELPSFADFLSDQGRQPNVQKRCRRQSETTDSLISAQCTCTTLSPRIAVAMMRVSKVAS